MCIINILQISHQYLFHMCIILYLSYRCVVHPPSDGRVLPAAPAPLLPGHDVPDTRLPLRHGEPPHGHGDPHRRARLHRQHHTGGCVHAGHQGHIPVSSRQPSTGRKHRIWQTYCTLGVFLVGLIFAAFPTLQKSQKINREE